MRKIYSLFLVLLMLPMLVSAQVNLAVSKTHSGSGYNSSRSESRVLIPFSAVNFVQPTPETGQNFSVGMWFKTTGISTSNPGTGVLLRLGTGNHMNVNGSLQVLHYSNGEIKLCLGGDNTGGSTGYEWSTSQASCGKSLGTAAFDEWHYLLLVFDSSNTTITAYLDGTQAFQDATAPVIGYKWDDGVFQAICQNYSGALDEFQLFDAALTADQAALAYVNASSVENLTSLFTFDEVKSETDGQFASVAGSVADAVAIFQNCKFGNYWAEGLVNLSSSTETAPVLIMGREIPATEVTITLQQPAEGGTFSVNDGTTDHTETFPTMTGTELTLTATPADGYNLVGFYTVDGTTETEITGNTYTPTADATLTARFTAETYTLTVANEQNIPYTLTSNGTEVTDLTAMLGGGAEYVLTLTVPNDKVLNAVRLGETELTGTNGVYTFTMSADATLTIDARAKAQYTVTINQPVGGTISATDNGTAVNSGDQVLEGTVLTLGNTPESGYKFVSYTVTGAELEGENVTVNSDITITGEFEEGIDYCIPTCANPGNPTRTTTSSTRGAKGLVISAEGATTVTFTPHTYLSTRNVYVDGTSSAILVTEPGKTVTVTVNGTGEWMNGFIYADWDLNGFTYDDLKTTNYTGGHTNIATSFTLSVPADLAPGDYRVRYILDWNNEDPCKFGETEKTQDNGEAVFDFLIRIESQEYETPRTITVVSANEELGTVAITNPESAETSISTTQKSVTVKATAAESATFKNWTNAAGEEVSTEATYTYTGTEDVTLTANFGHMLSVNIAAGGSIVSIVNGETNEAIANNTVVDPNTQVVVTVTPPEGKTTVVSVNDGTGIICDQNIYAFRINENSNVNFTFDDKVLTLQIAVVGDGTVECWSATPDDGETTDGTQYQDGDRIAYGSDIHFWAKPADGKDLTAVSMETNGTTTDLTIGNDIWQLEDGTGRYYMPVYVEDSIVITFTFSETQGIDGIGIDPANGPVEYYNLQGIRVDAENLVPGFYIVRQGNTAKKVLIQK